MKYKLYIIYSSSFLIVLRNGTNKEEKVTALERMFKNNIILWEQWNEGNIYNEEIKEAKLLDKLI